jgi:hypothetical protein
MKTLDQIKARDKLISDYANYTVEGMDMSDLCQFAYQTICENLERLHEDELLENVEEFASHLLDSVNE